MADFDQLKPGALFHGAYEVVRCISAGGMGAVYEVIHVETRRRRALKVMLPDLVMDPDLRARFKLEATVTADVDSEHIVEVFDAGVDEASAMPFLVMELLKGQDVSELLQRNGAFAPTTVVELLAQAAHALDKLHAVGIVHRDLKPENLFVMHRDDGTPRLKILDFGIAKIVAQTSQAKTTRSVGTPLYMSPEQIAGEGTIGPAADLYALAHIAFTLLVGEAYWEFEARSLQVYALLMKVMQGARDAASSRASACGASLPEAFDTWFQRATAMDPTARFATARALINELARSLDVDMPPGSRALANGFGQAGPDARSIAATEPSFPRFDALSNRTTRPISSDAIPKRPRSRILLPGVALSVVAIAGTAFMLRRLDKDQPEALAEIAVTSTPPAPRSGVPSASAADDGTQHTSTASTSVSRTTREPAVAKTRTSVRVTPPSPSAAMVPIASSSPIANTPPRKRPVDCETRPFDINAKGHKIPRPECF